MRAAFSLAVRQYDPELDLITEFGSVGQPEGMVEHGEHLYLGIYSYAILYKYDPSLAWEKDINPVKLFLLKDEGQDRPFALVPVGRQLAIGTVPTYRQLGGALTLYDLETGRVDVHRHVVADHSVVSLAFEDGLIYGGTSIHGGLGTMPQAAEGKLFLYGSLLGVLFRCVPGSGELTIIQEGIGHAAGDRAGRIYFTRDTELFLIG